MLLQLVSGHPMRDSDNVKTCVTGTGNIVRSITNDNSPTRIRRSAVLSGEPLDDHGRKLESVTRIITERTDTQIQVSVQTGYAKLDFRCDTQVSGQDSLDKPMLMQRGNGIGRAGIRRLIAGKLPLPLGHDAGHHLVKPLDAAFGDFRPDPRSHSGIHNYRFIGVPMHARFREDDRLFLETVRASDSPSEPT